MINLGKKTIPKSQYRERHCTRDSDYYLLFQSRRIRRTLRIRHDTLRRFRYVLGILLSYVGGGTIS